MTLLVRPKGNVAYAPGFDRAKLMPANLKARWSFRQRTGLRQNGEGGAQGSYAPEFPAYLTPQIVLYWSRYPLSGSNTFFGPPS